MYGGSGDDVFRSGSGKNYIHGGSGIDKVVYGSEDNIVKLNQNHSYKGNSVVDTLHSIEEVDLGNGNNVAWGNDSNNVLIGGKDTDRLSGFQGNDTLIGGAGNDILEGGYGDDVLIGGDGNDKMWGGQLFAGIFGRRLHTGNNHLFGGAGNDELISGITAGTDTIYGGSGNDTFVIKDGIRGVEGVAIIKDYEFKTDSVLIDDAHHKEFRSMGSHVALYTSDNELKAVFENTDKVFYTNSETGLTDTFEV